MVNPFILLSVSFEKQFLFLWIPVYHFFFYYVLDVKSKESLPNAMSQVFYVFLSGFFFPVLGLILSLWSSLELFSEYRQG